VNTSKKKKFNVYKLHKSLISHKEHARKTLSRNHPHALSFLYRKGIELEKIREYAGKLLASSALASSLVLGTPAIMEFPKDIMERLAELPVEEREKIFSQDLKTHLVDDSMSLSLPQEIIISKLINDYWGINATPVLEGKRLNHSFAYMGYEQHLVRFPGDKISDHDEFQAAGIAPGKGAWGYFANSKNDLNVELIQKEKYYVAVQTLYLSDWNTNWNELKEWYKYRKVVVVNPENGKTVIADIADAGPARWTGKQFGGSPEVMEHLGLITGKKKGKVILFFVNDPDNHLALGPVGYNEGVNLLASK
jgi:hypothetical protein